MWPFIGCALTDLPNLGMPSHWRRLWRLFTAIKVAIFAAFRMHRGWARFATFHDFLSLAKATTAATVAIVVVERFWSLDTPVSRGIIVLDWGATLIVVCALRSAARAAYSTLRSVGSIADRHSVNRS